jgi:hypothetical protein
MQIYFDLMLPYVTAASLCAAVLYARTLLKAAK